MLFTKQEIEKTLDKMLYLIEIYKVDNQISTQYSELYSEYEDTVFEYSKKIKEIKDKVKHLYYKLEDFLDE